VSTVEVREWPGKPAKGAKPALPDMVSVHTREHDVLICEDSHCGVVWETPHGWEGPDALEEAVRVHTKYHRSRRVRHDLPRPIYRPWETT
jgi:hypothetical protein